MYIGLLQSYTVFSQFIVHKQYIQHVHRTSVVVHRTQLTPSTNTVNWHVHRNSEVLHPTQLTPSTQIVNQHAHRTSLISQSYLANSQYIDSKLACTQDFSCNISQSYLANSQYIDSTFSMLVGLLKSYNILSKLLVKNQPRTLNQSNIYISILRPNLKNLNRFAEPPKTGSN